MVKDNARNNQMVQMPYMYNVPDGVCYIPQQCVQIHAVLYPVLRLSVKRGSSSFIKVDVDVK